MMPKKKSPGSKVTVYWENPPGPRQGVQVERVVRGHTYRRDVGPTGVLTAPEAASALQVSREFVYRLIWDKKLRTVRRRGQMVIPLSSVKEYVARREAKRRQRSQ